MALHGPTDLIAWLAGYDLAGLGALTEITESTEAVTADVTPLGPLGEIEHEAPIGVVRYAFSEAGHLRDNQASLRRLFASGAVTPPWPSIVGREGGAIGAECRFTTDVRIKSRAIIPATDNVTRIEIEYFLNHGGHLYEEAHVLAHGVVANTVDNGANPAAAYRLDLGASSSGGSEICVMVDVDETIWRGYPTLTMQARHSTTAGSGYANLGSAVTLARNSKGAAIVSTTGTVNRYVALRFTFSGTRDAFALKGAHSSGATALVVDGGTGLERIEAGDTLGIGSADYTVAAAEPASVAGEWNVTLTSGLTANAADNAVVTEKGDQRVVALCRCNTGFVGGDMGGHRSYLTEIGRSPFSEMTHGPVRPHRIRVRD